MIRIIPIFALIASACAAGQDQHLIPPSPGLGYAGLAAPSVLSGVGVVGPSVLSSRLVGPSVLSGVVGPSVLSSGVVGPSVLSGVVGPSVLSSRVVGPSVLSGVVGPSVLSSRLVGPSVLSGVVGPSVLSSRLVGPSVLSGVVGPSVLSSRVVGPSVLSAPVAVARPAAVAVEQVSYGSVPSYSVVNEPTSIVAPGRPIRGHSFSSEVRHDSRVALAAPAPLAVAAPVVSYSSQVVSAPALAAVPSVSTYSVGVPSVSAYSVGVPSVSAYSVGVPSVVASAPRFLATGPAAVVAGPASVKGYSLETGRTDLVSEVRLRAASIPAQVVQDTVVESAPFVASAPAVTFGAPLYSSALSRPVVTGQVLSSDWKK